MSRLAQFVCSTVGGENLFLGVADPWRKEERRKEPIRRTDDAESDLAFPRLRRYPLCQSADGFQNQRWHFRPTHKLSNHPPHPIDFILGTASCLFSVGDRALYHSLLGSAGGRELSVPDGFIDSPQISTRLEAAYRIYAFDIFHPAVRVRPPRRLNPRILSAHSKKYILRVQLPAASPRLTPEWEGTTTTARAECMSLSGRAAEGRGSRF